MVFDLFNVYSRDWKRYTKLKANLANLDKLIRGQIKSLVPNNLFLKLDLHPQPPSSMIEDDTTPKVLRNINSLMVIVG
jgi:hypothetical protein